MATKVRVVLAGAIGILIASMVFASDDSYRDGQGSIVPSKVLVRALKLTALDEYYRARVLLSSENGILLPLDNLTSICEHLNSKQQHVADGAYHSLQLELANEVFIYGGSGGPVLAQLRSDGQPETIKMSGVIRVAGGEITPLALKVDSGSKMIPLEQ